MNDLLFDVASIPWKCLCAVSLVAACFLELKVKLSIDVGNKFLLMWELNFM
jgi:hypothetical protein